MTARGFTSVDLVYKVKRIIEQEGLIGKGDRVLLGLSGGIDSTTLLFILREISRTLPIDLAVAHINHLLRGDESQRDEEFVVNLARSLSLPCYVTKVDVRKEAETSGKSLQHAGRDVRYRFYAETAASHHYGKIGVAHNLDDQVETFVLRVLKGTGMRGLSGIPMKRDNIIRPLLHTGRAEIEEYARAHAVPYVQDSSNEKVVYERNFIRKQIIPWMEKLNPAFREKVSLLINDFAAVNRIFDKQAFEFMSTESQWAEGEVSLRVDALNALDEETRFRVMTRLLGRMEPGFIPLREHMRQIDRVLTGRRPNLTATLPGGLKVRKSYERVFITRKSFAPAPRLIFSVGEGVNRLDPFGVALHVALLTEKEGGPGFFPDVRTAYFDADRLGALNVRTFREGDRFVPLGMKASVKLKDFFISRKIPREGRRRIPLLLSGDEIIWVIGHRVDERFKATEETEHKMRVYAEALPAPGPAASTE